LKVQQTAYKEYLKEKKEYQKQIKKETLERLENIQKANLQINLKSNTEKSDLNNNLEQNISKSSVDNLQNTNYISRFLQYFYLNSKK
jgi:hypothetical protein